MNSNGTCRSCSSKDQHSFGGEVALHFSGLAGLNKPITWVFPQILVCLKCGFAEFLVPGAERKTLQNGAETISLSKAAA